MIFVTHFCIENMLFGFYDLYFYGLPFGWNENIIKAIPTFDKNHGKYNNKLNFTVNEKVSVSRVTKKPNITFFWRRLDI